MVDFVKSIMTPDLLFGFFNIIKMFNNIFLVIKCCTPNMFIERKNKMPISKFDFNIDKGDFHCDFHLRR
jgi:hypothetical protein